jgi:hypothetical protein
MKTYQDISGLNSTINTILAACILLFFVIYIHYSFIKLHHKLLPFRSYSDILYWIYGNYNANTEAYDEVIDEIVQKHQDELSSKIRSSGENIVDVKKNIVDNITSLQAAIDNEMETYKKYEEDVSEKMKDFQDLINYTTEAQEKNQVALEEIKQLYIVKIRDYLDSILNKDGGVFDTIQYQYTMASLSSNLNSAKQPLERLYNSIYKIIEKNIGFIKKYIKPDFSIDKVPKFVEKKNIVNSGVKAKSIDEDLMKGGFNTM